MAVLEGMPVTEGRNGVRPFSARLFDAWARYHRKVGRYVQQDELAELVSKELKLRKPLTQGAVSKWLKPDGNVPKVSTIAALARVLDVDPGWLAFGSASKAPPPDEAPMTERLPEPD